MEGSGWLHPSRLRRKRCHLDQEEVPAGTHRRLSLSLIQCVLRRACLVVADVTARRVVGGATGRRDEGLMMLAGIQTKGGLGRAPWEGTGRP
ncbi:unnamed protein product [Rangifer tarandus platyrhynchus]|uniref:Uncharacterized protein n=1 Tax=Rangifer tarandus platyrhynchus TaxID=3082113 RepID=A0AC59YG72_RANTA